jgi:hypothetical protein
VTRRLILFAAVACLALAGAACAKPVDHAEVPQVVAQPDRATTTTHRPTTTTTEAPYVPVPADFTLTPVVTRKQCFGSAGCNVSYTMDVAYNSLEPLDEHADYAVTFEVRGGESVAIDTIELSGDGSYMDRENFTSTPNEGAVLSVVVTSVRER